MNMNVPLALQEKVEEPKSGKAIYWHRELPPFDAEVMGEHTIEANSARVRGTFAYRDELWSQCHESLMAQAHARLEHEVVRLGGDYAHVLSESVHTKRNASTSEAWLQGVFTYVLYRAADRYEQPAAVKQSENSARR
jgi:hypothetical protein